MYQKSTKTWSMLSSFLNFSSPIISSIFISGPAFIFHETCLCVCFNVQCSILKFLRGNMCSVLIRILKLMHNYLESLAYRLPPGSPAIKTLCFHWRGTSSIPDPEAKSLRAVSVEWQNKIDAQLKLLQFSILPTE